MLYTYVIGHRILNRSRIQEEIFTEQTTNDGFVSDKSADPHLWSLCLGRGPILAFYK